MGIALLSLRQAEKVEPQLKAAIKAVPQAQSALARSALAQAAQTRTEAAMAAAAAKPKALAEAGLSARERLALREGPAEAVAAALNARQYVQQIAAKDREMTRAQMVWALGRIEPNEIDTMLRSLAKMRGRYATLVLEYAQTERPIGHVALEELRGLRERIEEFERGLETIKTAILEGTAEVAGVKVAQM
jgi:predicted metal-dependent phosphoesterase TrpH